MPIKYLGSKRTLVPVLSDIARALEVTSALDLFSGTTRVAQAFKRLGIATTANDIASYSRIFGECYISIDARTIDMRELKDALERLSALPGTRGYMTRTFCEQARYFQPKNGRRIDAIREAIERDYAGSALYPILLTSLIEAADRVDSTTGLQMAYLKSWSQRSYRDLELRVPELIEGRGVTASRDACAFVREAGHYDLVYFDPPYNQHRYYTNYHVWETLVRWDAPESYGVARKRADAREEATKSPFNRKRHMPCVFRDVIENAQATWAVVSYNNESWVSPSDIASWLAARYGDVLTLDFDFTRYIGAKIGIYNPRGERVGRVSHVRNLEHIFVAGPADGLARVRAQLAVARPEITDRAHIRSAGAGRVEGATQKEEL